MKKFKYKKALKVRGGFAVPPRVRAIKIPKPTSKNIDDVIVDIAQKAAKTFVKKGYDTTASFVKRYAMRKALETGGKIIEMIHAPGNDENAGGDVPSVLSNSISFRNAADLTRGNAAKRSYRTKFESGRPTSRTLRELGKENGVAKITVFDSKWYNGEEPETTDGLQRGSLSQGHGFNLRSFVCLPAASYVDRDQVARLTAINLNAANAISPVNMDQRILGSLMNTQSRIELMNQNRFYPIQFKIHVVAVEGSSFDAPDVLTSLAESVKNQMLEPSAFADTNGDGVDEQFVFNNNQSIPDWFLVSNPARLEGIGQFAVTSWEQLRSGKGLESSEWFRENFNIVKTVTKTLDPGESWLFTHKHHFGGGFDLTAWFSPKGSRDRLTPCAYAFFIESTGVPCEGVLLTTGANSQSIRNPRLGTSPGRWFFEFQTKVEYVQASTSSQNLLAGRRNIAGFLESASTPFMHIRVYDNDVAGRLNVNKYKPFFVRLVDIDDSDAPIAGNFFLPVQTDTFQSSDGASTTSDAGQDETN